MYEVKGGKVGRKRREDKYNKNKRQEGTSKASESKPMKVL
jgi:hypothetical protein